MLADLDWVKYMKILQDLRREAMKEALRQKKEEMRREQDKLNSSLTTALCKSEEAVLTNKKWMDEIKVWHAPWTLQCSQVKCHITEIAIKCILQRIFDFLCVGHCLTVGSFSRTWTAHLRRYRRYQTRRRSQVQDRPGSFDKTMQFGLFCTTPTL